VPKVDKIDEAMLQDVRQNKRSTGGWSKNYCAWGWASMKAAATVKTSEVGGVTSMDPRHHLFNGRHDSNTPREKYGVKVHLRGEPKVNRGANHRIDSRREPTYNIKNETPLVPGGNGVGSTIRRRLMVQFVNNNAWSRISEGSITMEWGGLLERDASQTTCINEGRNTIPPRSG